MADLVTERRDQRNEVGPSMPAAAPPALQPHNLPLLRTKLFIPPRHRTVIPRPRLTTLIAQSAQFTLVSAPAGFGKTTLLAEWAESAQPSATGAATTPSREPAPPGDPDPAAIAWLSLDEDDNEPRRFLSYVVAAIENAAPGLADDTRALLDPQQPATPVTIMTSLINTLATREGRLILILDDYQVISAQPVHDVVTFLLEHSPPQLRLIVATRVDPPLPVARLRARDRMTEIRADDLRFTSEEAAAFLNQVMGLELETADLALLEERTEGWIAGLQMAALSLQGREDVSQFIQTFSGTHRYILDYLTAEVLERQPPAIQQFLLHTSILRRLCGPLCAAVMGQCTSAQELLERLEHANLFLTPLDDERRWYRYHPLFADLLRLRLEQSAPGCATELHKRAAARRVING